MIYRVEYLATDIDGCDIIECERYVVADSLPKAIHEVTTMAPCFRQRIIEITNYYLVDDSYDNGII